MRTKLHAASFVLCAGIISCSGPQGEKQEEPISSTAEALWVTCSKTGVTGQRGVKIIVKDANNAPVPCARINQYFMTNMYGVTDANGEAVLYEPGVMRGRFSMRLTHLDSTQSAALFPMDLGVGRVYHLEFGNPTQGASGNVGEGYQCTITASAAYVPPGVGQTHCDLPPPQAAIWNVATPYGPTQRVDVKVLDDVSGVPLPGAVLTRLDKRSVYVSDNKGMVALHEQDRQNLVTQFKVEAPGYQSIASQGINLTPGASEQAIELVPQAEQVAQRLYRMTGVGLERETHLLGTAAPSPTDTKLINADVLGQDGPMATLYTKAGSTEKVFWTFGDTRHPNHDNDNLAGSGATSDKIPTDLNTSLPLTYYKTDTVPGFARERSVVAKADFSPTINAARWPFGLSTIDNRLYTWVTIVNTSGTPWTFYPIAVGVFDDATNRFTKLGEIPHESDATNPNFTTPGEHSFKVKEGATEYLHSGGFMQRSNGVKETLIRVRAAQDALIPSTTFPKGEYEEYTPYKADGTVDRPSGRPIYAWKKQINDPVLNTGLNADERLVGQMRVLGGAGGSTGPILQHKSTRQFNTYRNRYVNVFNQWGSSSSMYYSEADTPVGPWAWGRRIVNQAANTNPPSRGFDLYNPHLLPFYGQGKTLYFAAVFAHAFANTWEPIPRYDYNVVMNRLKLTDANDVDDVRTVVPVPVYNLVSSATNAEQASKTLGMRGQVRAGMLNELPAPFFAYDRKPEAARQAVPAYWTVPSCRNLNQRLVVYNATPVPSTQLITPDFYVISKNAPEADRPAADFIELREFKRASDGSYVYGLPGTQPTGYDTGTLIGYVLKNHASKVWIPVTQYRSEVVANAGADQCFPAPAPGTSTVNVALTSTSTAAVSDPIVSYRWERGNNVQIATTANTNVALTPGDHFIKLTVTTASGKTSEDRMIVSIAQTQEFDSIPADDGKIAACNSANTSGCLFNAGENGVSAIHTGDNSSGVALRSILSFNTTALNAAAVLGVQVVLKSGSTSGTPFPVELDVANGTFGAQALESTDFTGLPASGGFSNVGTLTGVGAVFTATIASDKLGYFHCTGAQSSTCNASRKVQVRVRGNPNTDLDAVNDQRGFFSGEAATVADRPKLRISYWAAPTN